MTDILQAMNVRYYKTARGYSAHMTSSQYNKLRKLDGVVIVESQQVAVMIYAGRVVYGFFVRWVYAAVEQQARAA